MTESLFTALLAELRRHCNDQWRLCVCDPRWDLYCDDVLPLAEEFARARQAEVWASSRAGSMRVA